MFGNTKSWYTDKLTIYRTQSVKINNITRQQRILVRDNIRCRVYRNNNPALTIKDTAADYSNNNMLACDIDVDIKAGDELHIIKMFYVKENRTAEDVYIAGNPMDFETPYGNVSPDISHKQVSLQNIERS